jgi:hypothetical protein
MPPGAEKLDFRGIWAWDDNTAIVMASGPGDASRLYKTTDGCSSWKLVFTNPDKDGFCDAIVFGAPGAGAHSPQAGGVLIGDPVNGVFAIFDSGDKGSTWTRFNSDDPKHQPKARPGESLFAAGNQAAITPGDDSGFAFVTGGADSRIYEEEIHEPFDAAFWVSLGSERLRFASGSSAGAFAIGERLWSDPMYCDFMIVGGDYRKPDSPAASAFVSGKFRWPTGSRRIEWSAKPPHGYRSAVAWDSGAKAWIAAGTNGSDISYDDGNTWVSLDNGNWNALSLPWVVGPNGRVGKLDPDKLKRK